VLGEADTVQLIGGDGRSVIGFEAGVRTLVLVDGSFIMPIFSTGELANEVPSIRTQAKPEASRSVLMTCRIFRLPLQCVTVRCHK